MIHDDPAAPPLDDLDRPEIVTVCGSMQFFPRMLDCAASETSEGRIVLAPFVTLPPEGQKQQAEFKEKLDQLHRDKIAMSDSVIVVTDETYYIGESTAAEITFATMRGLPILMFVYAGTSSTPVEVAPIEWRDQLLQEQRHAAGAAATGASGAAGEERS